MRENNIEICFLKKGEENMRNIEVGNIDFKEIIEMKSLYVDKTLFIKDIVENRAKVQLFTRPRRFGKTTMLYMVKTFFDISKKEENKKIFEGLKIENTNIINSHFGQHPVVLLSFKDIKYNTFDESLDATKNLISHLYGQYKYVKEKLDEREKEIFENIYNNKKNLDFTQSLKILMEYLYKYWNKKVVILIDEYDTPLITAYEKDYYDKIINFFRIFYGSSFKDNEYLEKAIIKNRR